MCTSACHSTRRPAQTGRQVSYVMSILHLACILCTIGQETIPPMCTGTCHSMHRHIQTDRSPGPSHNAPSSFLPLFFVASPITLTCPAQDLSHTQACTDRQQDQAYMYMSGSCRVCKGFGCCHFAKPHYALLTFRLTDKQMLISQNRRFVSGLISNGVCKSLCIMHLICFCLVAH